MVKHNHIAEKPVDGKMDHSKRRIQVIDRYETEAKQYDLETYRKPHKRLFSKLQCESIEKLIKAKKTDKILDVGSGTGRFLKYFSHKGYDISGVEPAKNMIAVSKEKLKGHTINIKKGDIENIPYPDNHFDKIITMHVLMHLHPKTIQKGIPEIMRVLKPGGKAYLDFPHKRGLWNILGTLLIPNPTRTVMYTKADLKKLAKGRKHKISGIFSFPRFQYKISWLRGISYFLESKIKLPLIFRSQLILIIEKRK